MRKSTTALGALACGTWLVLSCSSPVDNQQATPPPNQQPAQPGNQPAVETPVDTSKNLNAAQHAQFQQLKGELAAAQALDAAAVTAKHSLQFGSLGYDPSSAEFLDKIQASALALNDGELAKLKTNGFVIAPRQGFPTFVKGYAAIYSEHLPVYISADAILEAVHSSYDELLKNTEQAALIPKVHNLLGNVHKALGAHAGAEGAADLDLYLAVALSLLSGQTVGPVAGADAAAINDIVEKANAATGLVSLTLFGDKRDEDTSQFVPRGHYTDTEELSRYFRAMMWLGRIDFRLIETLPDGSTELRRPQVNAAFLLHQLLSAVDFNAWEQVDSALQVFVGTSDYMVVPELGALLTELGGYDAALAADDATLKAAIISGGYGMQLIASHIAVNGGVVDTLPLNRSFALFGQRYVLDSHVFSQVVYDRTKDLRMMPNPLDAAYAALGNDAALPLLQSELATYGVSYPGRLEGARVLSDAHGEDFWSASLYNLWLGALRELSPKASELADPVAAGLPKIATTEPWSRRILNTQLGSWAELRHDTLLYAKQSYTGVPACEFPDAYVDPYPEFYTRLAQYAELGTTLTNDLASDLGPYQAMVADYFTNLHSSMSMLAEMAESQRSGTEFTEAQMAFINDAVRIEQQTAGCTTINVPDGWLADLYLEPHKSIEFEPTIADVHTQPADEMGNTVGKVLHVATGVPRLMVTTVDTCQGPRAYVGVTFAYHEKVTEGFKRYTDEEWAPLAPEAEEVSWMTPVLGN